MVGESNLEKLLSDLSPTLMPGEFVFCTFENACYGGHSEMEPVATILENEGLTLVIPRSKADQYELRYESVFRGITPGVYSSLDAVGLTAAIAGRLAEHGKSANVIAGYFHDHTFVQKELAQEAMTAIREPTDYGTRHR